MNAPKKATSKLKSLKAMFAVVVSLVSTFAFLSDGMGPVRAKVTDALSNVTGTLHGGISGGADADSGTGQYSDDPSSLTVAEQGSMKGYSRARFGPAWTDDVSGVEAGHNGCDTRNDILRRDLTGITTANGCTVLAGTLADPYTGKVIEFRRGKETSSAVQIDHLVPLGNAWVSGAAHWPLARMKAIANDPMNLLAVDGSANMSKSDKNAAQWLPPNQAFRCIYVKSQVRVKNRYKLTVTSAEKQVMMSYYGQC